MDKTKVIADPRIATHRDKPALSLGTKARAKTPSNGLKIKNDKA
jgi:hypothetical protein